jgi:hypothetical protein
MVWIQPTERGKEHFVETVDETIADTNRVSILHGEWSDGIHHALVVFGDGSRDQLSVQASRFLANVFEDGMWLVTVPGAQLRKDGRTNLLETKLENLGMNSITYRIGIDVCLVEVKSAGRSAMGPSCKVGSKICSQTLSLMRVVRLAAPCHVVRL